MKNKKMSRTKVIKNLRAIRSLLTRLHNNGNIIGVVTEEDQALTEAIRLIKLDMKSISDKKKFEKFGIRIW